MRRILLRSCLLLGLGASAQAGGVHIVEPTGTARFGTIQGAVDAAAEGDLLLVSAGTYAGFSVSGKGLSIVAAPGHQVLVASAIAIEGLPAGSTLLLSGLRVEGQTFQDGIRATACAGRLRIQDCESIGGGNTSSGDAPGAGLQLTNCAMVAIESCTLRGGSNLGGWMESPPGGPGLRAHDSNFTVHGSELRGGAGVNNQEGPSHGGHGCHTSGSSWFFASGTIFQGGWAAHGCEVGMNANGGAGLFIQGQPSSALDCTFTGGQNEQTTCSPGGFAPGVLGCCLETVPGEARAFSARTAAGDRRMLAVDFSGVPGDRAFLFASPTPGFALARELAGTWLIEQPHLFAALPLGVVPASGRLSAEVLLPTLAPGSVWQGLYFQALALSSSGELRLANSRTLALLDRRSGPDCDMDGVQDFAAVIDGSVPDVDQNLVPDACDWNGPDWYVDANAPGPGSGAPNDPFRSLGQAFGVASSGHRILASAGLYDGVENRNLDYLGRSLEVIGVDGAQACILDCQQAGRGFLFLGGPMPGARLEGFTVRNGVASFAHAGTTIGKGGGIYVANQASPEIAACIIEECEALDEGYETGFGGGIYVAFGSTPRILDSTLRRNRARAAGGAIHLHSATLLRRCVLEENAVTAAFVSGGVYGGGAVMVWFNSSVIDQCLIRWNVSANRGGGVALAGSPGQPTLLSHSRILENSAERGGGVALGGVPSYSCRIDNCEIAGNSADSGGGILKQAGGIVSVLNCTVVGNQSGTAGAGFRHQHVGPDIPGANLLANCIFWRNVGPGDIQVASEVLPATQLRYCFVSSGAAGISGSVDVGPGLLSGSPGFLDPIGADGDPGDYLDNDYRLAPGSICIDAGSNPDVGSDIGDIDEDGDSAEPTPLDLLLQPRFVDDPAAPDTGNGAPPLVDLGAHERQP